MVMFEGAATLYFLTNGLHNFSLTNNSKLVFAKTLITGEIGGGKKLEQWTYLEKIRWHLRRFTLLMKMLWTYHPLFHSDAFERISNKSN